MTPLTNSIEETLSKYIEGQDAPIIISEITQSIITKVKESLPEKQKIDSKFGDYNMGVQYGWNQAIKDMEERLSL